MPRQFVHAEPERLHVIAHPGVNESGMLDLAWRIGGIFRSASAVAGYQAISTRRTAVEATAESAAPSQLPAELRKSRYAQQKNNDCKHLLHLYHLVCRAPRPPPPVPALAPFSVRN